MFFFFFLVCGCVCWGGLLLLFCSIYVVLFLRENNLELKTKGKKETKKLVKEMFLSCHDRAA